MNTTRRYSPTLKAEVTSTLFQFNGWSVKTNTLPNGKTQIFLDRGEVSKLGYVNSVDGVQQWIEEQTK